MVHIESSENVGIPSLAWVAMSFGKKFLEKSPNMFIARDIASCQMGVDGRCRVSQFGGSGGG